MPVKIMFKPIYIKDKKYPVSTFDKVVSSLADLLQNDIGPEISGEYKDQVKGWSTPPSFPVVFKSTYNGARLQIDVGPKGKGTTHWIYVNKGTRTRRIFSRGQRPMTFPRQYTPKTTPGGSYGGPGRRHGDTVVTHVVQDHSIAPREFEQKIVTPSFIRSTSRKIRITVDKVIGKYG